MRQPMTIRIDREVLARAKEEAKSQNRTLTNYIETLLKADVATREGINRKPSRNALGRTGLRGRGL